MANSATRKRTNFNNYDFDPEISGSSLSHTVKTTSVIDDNGEKQPGIVAETYADADQDTDAADADGGDMDYRDYTNAETYDPDVDYQALINDAVTDKNYVAAGLLENLRNMKIKGEEIADQGLTYAYHNPEVVVTDNGLTDSKGTYLDGMLDVLKEQYREALEANDAATAASVRQAIDKLNAQKEALQQQYDELAKQLYIDRRMGEKNLPQQLAAMGYSGGLTESSMLGLATSYQQALAENERSRAQGYTDIEQQIADAQLTGELSKAQTEQELAQNYFSNYASIAQQLQSQANWDKQFGYQQQQWDKQFGYQQQQDEKSAQRTARQDALAYVEALIAMGYTPTAEQLAAAGITAEQLAAAGITTSRFVRKQTTDTDPPTRDEEIAAAASEYYNANPNVALDSYTLDGWLADNGYYGSEAQTFKAYMEAYGARRSRG